MADIDKIAVNNTTYNIKDSTARDSISQGDGVYAPNSIAVSDMNDLVKGVCMIAGTTANIPSDVTSAAVAITIGAKNSNNRWQLLVTPSKTYVRTRTASGWGAWRYFTETVLS